MAFGDIKRSRSKIRRAYHRDTKPFKNVMKLKTIAPVWRVEKGYAAFVCTATSASARQQMRGKMGCSNTAYASTPTLAVARAHRNYARMIQGRHTSASERPWTRSRK